MLGLQQSRLRPQGGRNWEETPKTQKCRVCPKPGLGRLELLSEPAGEASLLEELCPFPHRPFTTALPWLTPAP